jgi:hypothetical protein
MALHTTRSDKEEQRRKLAADIAEYAARGGVTQAITPEQYRQHNIEREARRDRESAMRDLEQQMDSSYNSWETIDDRREARTGLLSRTYGLYSKVDGDERNGSDDYAATRAEVDFFNDWTEDFKETLDNDHDYDEWE